MKTPTSERHLIARRPPVIGAIAVLCLVTTAAIANAAPPVNSVVYEDCYEQAGAFPLPAAALRQYMPPGFAPSFGGTPFVGALPGVGSFNVLYISCTVEGEQVKEMIAVLEVTPPQYLRLEGANWHFLAVSGLTTSERSAQRYASWCFGDIITHGDVDISASETPLAIAGHATATDETSAVTMDSVTGGPSTPTTGGEGRLFGVKDGTVHYIDVSFNEAIVNFGSGTVRVDGGFAPTPSPIQGGFAVHITGQQDNTLTASSRCGRPLAPERDAIRIHP